MDNLTERDKQAQELSAEIITLARNSILVNLRFMDRAVGNFRCLPAAVRTSCTVHGL